MFMCAVSAMLSAAEPLWNLQPPGWPVQQFGSFYARPDQAGTLVIATPPQWDGKTVDYTLKNYDGQIVKRDSVSCSGGRAHLPIQLAAGWYGLSFAEMPDVESGILVRNDFEGTPDPFFGVDMVLAWQTRGNQPELRRQLIGLLPRLGIVHARDRFRWPLANPEAGRFDFDNANQDRQLAAMYRDAGVKLLITFHDTPAYLKDPDSVYPADIIAAAAAWKTILQNFNGQWDAVEAWNEPDIRFGGPRSADRYAEVPKMLAAANRQAGKPVKVVGGVLATINPAFINTMTDNQLPTLCDAMSFHSYEPPFQFIRQIKEYRRLLPPGTPIWVTEAGEFFRTTPKDANIPLTPAQENLVAQKTAAKGAVAKALNLERYYPFIFIYLENWNKTEKSGLLKPDLTPGRGCAAYAQLIRALANRKFTGELDLAQPHVKAFRFDHDLLVLFTDRPDLEPTVTLPLIPAKVCGIDGRTLSADGNQVRIRNGLIYVYPSGQSDTELVIKPEFTGKVSTTADGWFVQNPADGLHVNVKISNLGHQAHDAVLTASFPGTAICKHIPFRVDDQKQVVLPLDFTAAELAGLPVTGVVLRLNAPGATDSVAQLYFNNQLETLLKKFQRPLAVPFADVSRWKEHQLAGTRWSVEGGETLKMQFVFPKKSRHNDWAVPFFELPEHMSLTGAAGVVIRARATGDPTANILFALLDPFEYRKMAVLPVNDEYFSIYIDFKDLFQPMALGRADFSPGAEVALDRVKQLHFGVTNCKSGTFTIEISDMYLVWQ